MDKFSSFVRGLAFFAIIAMLIVFSIYLDWGPFAFLGPWLGQSGEPRSALISFAILLTALFFSILRLGFEFSPLSRWISNEKIHAYIAGLPLWALIFIAILSGSFFWRHLPTCLPPSGVLFEISGQEKPYLPLSTIEVTPGQSLTLIARPTQETKIFSCSWEYMGEIFDHVGGDVPGCQISLRTSVKGGEGIITLATTQNFCPQKSLFSITIRAIP